MGEGLRLIFSLPTKDSPWFALFNKVSSNFVYTTKHFIFLHKNYIVVQTYSLCFTHIYDDDNYKTHDCFKYLVLLEMVAYVITQRETGSSACVLAVPFSDSSATRKRN